MPVGHIWKFDLEKTFSLDFGVKCNFSKNQIEHVMLNFLATTENTRKIRSDESNFNCGKIVKICNFQNIIRTRVELSYPWHKAEGDREWRRSKLEWTRMNLRWKNGQLKLHNGLDQKLVS